MDNDAQFLLGSASAAMEERDRLRAKHERLKHEAAAVRSMQLKEASAIDESLSELDAEHRELDARMQSLDERERRLEYEEANAAHRDGLKRKTKIGYLRGQVEGWAAEFERVTAITGVKFGEGKSDAVDKVVQQYSANELRNRSLAAAIGGTGTAAAAAAGVGGATSALASDYMRATLGALEEEWATREATAEGRMQSLHDELRAAKAEVSQAPVALQAAGGSLLADRLSQLSLRAFSSTCAPPCMWRPADLSMRCRHANSGTWTL